jgi:hypothetical protein
LTNIASDGWKGLITRPIVSQQKGAFLKDEGHEMELHQGSDDHVGDRDRLNRVRPHGAGGPDDLGFFEGLSEKRTACGDVSS